jgi:hypothetical protein
MSYVKPPHFCFLELVSRHTQDWSSCIGNAVGDAASNPEADCRKLNHTYACTVHKHGLSDQLVTPSSLTGEEAFRVSCHELVSLSVEEAERDLLLGSHPAPRGPSTDGAIDMALVINLTLLSRAKPHLNMVPELRVLSTPTRCGGGELDATLRSKIYRKNGTRS